MHDVLFRNDNKTPIFHNVDPLIPDAFCVRLTEGQHEWIDRVAAEYGVSRAKVARWMVSYAMQNAKL